VTARPQVIRPWLAVASIGAVALCLGTLRYLRPAQRTPVAPTPLVIPDDATFDYTFAVYRTVVNPDCQPIPGVEVELRLQDPVYDVITPVQTARRTTAATGKFVFKYIACERPTKSYIVTFLKPGFQPLVLSERGFESEPTVVIMVPLVGASGGLQPNPSLQRTRYARR